MISKLKSCACPLVLLLLFLSCPSVHGIVGDSSIADTKQTTFDETAERQLVQLINQARAMEGLKPLAVDRRLTEAARKHTLLMIGRQDLQHQYEDESPLQLRYVNENVRSDRQGENIALEVDVVSAHQSLMHSPGHRANILNPDYNAVGVGIVNSGHEVYVTEDFARLLPDYSEHEADRALQHTIEKFTSSRGLPRPVRKAQSSLHQTACKLALNDSLDTNKPLGLPGARGVVEWTASDLEKVPSDAAELLAQPSHSTYSLGVCFAPSVSHTGGIYWVVMVVY